MTFNPGETFLKSGAVFDRSSWPVISVKGKDRLDYLHRLSSQSFRDLQPGDSVPGAFLNAQGSVIALFQAWVRPDEVLLLMEKGRVQNTLFHLEKYVFSEDLKFEDVSGVWSFWEVIGGSEETLKEIGEGWPRIEKISNPIWGCPAQLFCFEDSIRAAMFGNSLEDHGFRRLNDEEYDRLRVLCLIPKDGVDVGPTTILLEAGLYKHFHPNKGCYPGQEVVERLLTKGKVPKRLTLFKASTKVDMDEGPFEIMSDGKAVGLITSSKAYEGEHFLLGYIQRGALEKKSPLSLGDSALEVLEVVKGLPQV